MATFRWSWLIALSSLLLGAGTAYAADDIRAAYQREFAFLEAEKHSLTDRLARIESESLQAAEQAKAAVDNLQAQVLGLSLQSDRMTEMLSDVEREADSVSEDDDLLETVLTQASATLEKGKIALPEAKADDPDSQLNQARFAFEQGMKLLGQFSSVRQEAGEFFAADGEKVAGTLIHVGRIGSYGISPQASGTLAPAGGDRLKIWPEADASTTASALAGGQTPDRLRLFLYESLEQEITQREQQDLWQHIDSGGVIGWVIVGVGALAMLMVIVRAILLSGAAANTTHLVEQITPLVERKQFEAAVEICRKAKNASGRVLVATLRNLHRDRAELEDIVSEAVLHEQPALDRFGSAIIMIASVAPLLGLLGTVTGMIATFDIITEFGTGNPKLLSGGIAIALVTTELGLIAAIPALVAGNLLSAWAESIKDSMDKAALRVVNLATGIRISERPSLPPAMEPDPSGGALAAT